MTGSADRMHVLIPVGDRLHLKAMVTIYLYRFCLSCE